MIAPERGDQGPGATNAVFRLATTPARWVSRFHAALRDALAEDAVTFRGSAGGVFTLLALIAVAYPIVASVAHGSGIAPSGIESQQIMTAVVFTDVYTESIIFMIAAAGLGAFSPALAVLFLTVLIPADLVAAAVSSIAELQPPAVFDPWPTPLVGRAISYGLLWILAVEIPLRVRRWATSAADGWGGMPSVARVALATMLGTAVLVFFWARAMPWLIQPVMQWTNQGRIQMWATEPLWAFWQMLVIGTAVIAGVAAVWPKRSGASANTHPADQAPGAPRSQGRTLVRHTASVMVLALLLAGLAANWLEAAILVVGLLITGPILTVILPMVPQPRFLPRAGSTARWVIAMVIALAASWLILTLTVDEFAAATFQIVVALAVVGPIFRLVLEAGATRSGATEPPVERPRVPPAVTSAMLVLGLALWLGLPALALANDCPNGDESGGCAKSQPDAAAALLGGAMLATGAALAQKKEPSLKFEMGDPQIRDKKPSLKFEMGDPQIRDKKPGLKFEMGDPQIKNGPDSGGPDKKQP